MLSVWAALLGLVYVAITSRHLNPVVCVIVVFLLVLCLPTKVCFRDDDGNSSIERVYDAVKKESNACAMKDDKTKDKEEK